MSEKNYFGEMKLLLREEKKLVIGGLTVMAVILIILGIWLLQKGNDGGNVSMSVRMAEYLEKEGFSYMPEEQIDELSEKVTGVLDKMVAAETDKAKMVQAVKETVLGMNLGIGDSEADEMASWLVELYLEHYDAVYDEEGKMNHSLQAGHALLEQDLLSIQEYLGQLEQSVQQNQQELADLSGVQNSSYTAASEYMYRTETLITELINIFQSCETKYADGQSSAASEFSAIQAELNGLLMQVEDSQKTLEEYLGTSESNNSGRYEAVRNEVDALQNSLEKSLSEVKNSLDVKISELQKDNSNTSTAQSAELKAAGEKITEELQKAGDENHSELLSRLSEMDNAFDSLNTSLAADVTSIHQGVTDSKAEMLQQLAVMESSLNTSVLNISGSMNGNQEEVLERIAEVETGMSNSMASIQNGLQSVFQSVSNGKALLASALLTKNVTIDEDATFQELYDAILAVPQEIVLGETQIPGEIEYEYHYHTGDAENGGGCYTIEDVHQHVGSCYMTCTYINGGCEGEGLRIIDGWMHCPYEYKHSYCTSGEWRKSEYVHIDDGMSHRGESGGTHLVVVCGKTEGTHYGWRTGCGLADGQITGARITYAGDAVSIAAE